MINKTKKIRSLLLFVLIILLVACNSNDKNKVVDNNKETNKGEINKEENKEPDVIDLEDDNNNDEISGWHKEENSWTDNSNPKEIKYYGYNTRIYDVNKEVFLPEQNKFDIVYYPDEDLIDIDYYFPKGASFKDIVLKEAIYIKFKVDFNENKLLEVSQVNEDGENVEYFKLEDADLLHSAEVEKTKASR